jgi:hypothetical protein
MSTTYVVELVSDYDPLCFDHEPSEVFRHTVESQETTDYSEAILIGERMIDEKTGGGFFVRMQKKETCCTCHNVKITTIFFAQRIPVQIKK